MTTTIINIDDSRPPNSEELRRQALWLINAARTFKGAAENDDHEAAELWGQTTGLFDGITSMTPEELVTLFFARSSMAVLLIVRFAELAAEHAHVPIGELFDQAQLLTHDAELTPPDWDSGSSDSAS